MVRIPTATVLAMLSLGAGLLACTNPERERARSLEAVAATNGEDDEACRSKGAPGTEAYDDCRQAIAEAQAQEGAIQERKRRDFDRVLGAGTDDYRD